MISQAGSTVCKLLCELYVTGGYVTGWYICMVGMYRMLTNRLIRMLEPHATTGWYVYMLEPLCLAPSHRARVLI